uniref:Uncharacterized protein n=1 Tax=Steinernema glaseri TaxID=37863 RepID=A0A1I7XXQ5_9BILA
MRVNDMQASNPEVPRPINSNNFDEPVGTPGHLILGSTLGPTTERSHSSKEKKNEEEGLNIGSMDLKDAWIQTKSRVDRLHQIPRGDHRSGPRSRRRALLGGGVPNADGNGGVDQFGAGLWGINSAPFFVIYRRQKPSTRSRCPARPNTFAGRARAV